MALQNPIAEAFKALQAVQENPGSVQVASQAKKSAERLAALLDQLINYDSVLQNHRRRTASGVDYDAVMSILQLPRAARVAVFPKTAAETQVVVDIDQVVRRTKDAVHIAIRQVFIDVFGDEVLPHLEAVEIQMRDQGVARYTRVAADQARRAGLAHMVQAWEYDHDKEMKR